MTEVQKDPLICEYQTSSNGFRALPKLNGC